MRDRTRPLTTLALALAALVGAAPLALPAAADAQGNRRETRQERGKSKGQKHMDRMFGVGTVRLDDARRDRARDRRRDRDDRDRRWDDDRRPRWTPAPGRGRAVRTASYGVPPGHLPPPGLCRVWVAGVPPGRQPAPTDCATALRRRPANARVLWGAGTSRDRVVRRDGACVDRDRDGRLERTRVRTASGVVRTICR